MTSMSVLDPAAPVRRDVATEVASLAGVLNMATSRLVEVVEHAIEAGDTNEAGMTSPAAWLAWRSGLSPERAGQLVRLAKVRDRYPSLFEAFGRGEVSADQMTELVKAPEWAQHHVLGFAEIATVSRLRRAIRDDAFEGDPDAPSDEAPPKPPADRLSFGVRDGRWRITGQLDLVSGRRVETALTESKDRLFGEGEVDASWVDALVDIAERSFDAVPSSDRRDRYRTWIHVDAGSGRATTTDGWQIPQSLAQLILCDGLVAPVWERDGVAFSVGRMQRVVPDRTRRIVERRDRGCRVPGCTADRFVEVHHIVHWVDGGATDTANLLALCARHHRMHHQGRLGIVGDADAPDGVLFTDARGSPIAAAHPPTPPTEHPRCDRVDTAPPAGRMNYDWVGLGWVHPNALERRRRRPGS